MSVIVIVLNFGLLSIIACVAYWFTREEQKTIKRIPPEEMDEKERQASLGETGMSALCCFVVRDRQR